MKPKTKFLICLTLFYTVGLLALVGSCAGQNEPPPPRQNQTTDIHIASTQALTPTAPEVAPAVQLASPRTTPPPMIAVLVDFSASIAYYGVNVPTVADLRPLIDVVDQYGGELGVGAIQENPSTPLLRLRIPPPEKGLEPPGKEIDVFTRAKLMRVYRNDLPEHKAREEKRRERNQAIIEDFITRLEKFLDRKPTARSTDLWGNVRRAQTFLLEDPLYWTGTEKTTPQLYLLVISDGRHNASRSVYRSLDPSIKTIAVSGVSGLGDLGRIDGIRWFESAASAAFFVTANVGRE